MPSLSSGGTRTRARQAAGITEWEVTVVSEAVSMLATETALIIPAPRADRGRGAEPEGCSSAAGTVDRDPWALALVTATAMGTRPAGRQGLAPALSPPLTTLTATSRWE